MLRSKITFCLLLISALAFSQNADSIYQVQQRQIRELEQKIQSAENQNKIIGSKLNELSTKISSLSSENVTLNTALLQKQHSIDSLQKQVAMNSANIQATADSLGIRIQTTDKAYTKRRQPENEDPMGYCGYSHCLIGFSNCGFVASQERAKIVR